MSVVSVALAAAVVLSGCSGGGSDVAEGERPSGSATSAPSPSASAAALEDAVLTTSELPTGGWTLRPDESSSGETSTDRTSSDPCHGDFGDLFTGAEDADQAGSQWTREATNSTLSVDVVAYPDAADRLRDLASAIRSCPTSSSFTSSEQATRVDLALVDLGAWGDERTCFRFDLQQGATSAYAKMCLVAVGEHLVLTSALSAYSFDVPEDDEVAQVTAAAVDKAARVLG